MMGCRTCNLLIFICFITGLFTSCEKPDIPGASFQRQIDVKILRVGSIGGSASPPVHYSFDIFPMPFADSTTLRLEMDGTAQVKLSLSGENGQFYPVAEELLNGGIYDFRLYFNNFEEGIYIGEISVGEVVDRFYLIHQR